MERIVNLTELIDSGYQLIPNVNDKFIFKFRVKNEWGNFSLQAEEVVLKSFKKEPQTIDYVANFEFKNRNYSCVSWRLMTEGIVNVNYKF